MSNDNDIRKSDVQREINTDESNQHNIPSADAIQGSIEPEAEILSYMGTDSTAVNEIIICSVGEELDDAEGYGRRIKTWTGELEANPVGGSTRPINDLLSDGVTMVREISADANRLINSANRDFANRAIQIGILCIKLKSLLSESKRKWGPWAEENLPFIARRNREKYMRLAKRRDCWPFSFLGVDRLDELCTATGKMSGEDRIGDLFRTYGIPFDEGSELNMTEFRLKIDTAIANERLIKKSIKIDPALVEAVIRQGIEVDGALIRRLSDAISSGGNPSMLLEKISLEGGQEPQSKAPETRVRDFNSLSNKLIKTIEFIAGDRDHLDRIDRESLERLLEKLQGILEQFQPETVA